MATSSPSLAHLLFMGSSSDRAGGGGAWAGHGLLPRELSRGFRRDTRGTLSEKTPNQIHGALAYAKLPRRKPQRLIPDLLTQIAREDYREASAKCLRAPTRTCKYQCFGFRGVNMSPHTRRFLHFKKKTWLSWPSWPLKSAKISSNLGSIYPFQTVVVGAYHNDTPYFFHIDTQNAANWKRYAY